jgi:hypothetical protein
MLRLIALVAALASGSVAFCTPYWIDWEGDNWPEAVGYERNWGNSQGQYQGPGANRTLENGILTYDSLYDPSVYDVYGMERPGQMDPPPGELFVMEWGLKVDIVNGAYDPGLGVFSDDAWGLALYYANDHIYSALEGYLSIPFTPYAWHDYRVISSDMRAYDLFIDGALAHHGTFAHTIGPSYISFGDRIVPASSVHHWDYFRFGVTPEPSTFLLLMWVTVWRGARRG